MLKWIDDFMFNQINVFWNLITVSKLPIFKVDKAVLLYNNWVRAMIILFSGIFLYVCRARDISLYHQPSLIQV